MGPASPWSRTSTPSRSSPAAPSTICEPICAPRWRSVSIPQCRCWGPPRCGISSGATSTRSGYSPTRLDLWRCALAPAPCNGQRSAPTGFCGLTRRTAALESAASCRSWFTKRSTSSRPNSGTMPTRTAFFVATGGFARGRVRRSSGTQSAIRRSSTAGPGAAHYYTHLWLADHSGDWLSQSDRDRSRAAAQRMVDIYFCDTRTNPLALPSALS
jgi:hypothetical protein